MRVVIKKVGQEPEIREINGELHEMQNIVGGWIECFNVVDNIVCVCDEEGKLKNYQPNFFFNGDVIVGDVFFCVAGEEDFESLNDEDAKFVIDLITIMCAKGLVFM